MPVLCEQQIIQNELQMRWFLLCFQLAFWKIFVFLLKTHSFSM